MSKDVHYCTIALISHASKVMLKILQARPQQYAKWEIPDVQAGFRKGRGIRDQIANICWMLEKARKWPEKKKHKTHIFLLHWLCKRLCVNLSKLWKLFKEIGIPYHFTCLLRNLYVGQEATVKTRHGTIGKVVWQNCILSPYLFNFHAEYIIQNAGLDESQPGIKTARRNTNNLRYADETTIMAESEEELKNLLMRVKEETEKADLKLNIQKTKIEASGPITSWQIEEGKVEVVTDFIFLGSKITTDGDCSQEIRYFFLGMKAMQT